MIRRDARKVVFHHSHSPCKCHMPTAAEQSHSRKAQDGGNQRGIWDTTQTFDATLEASCRRRKKRFCWSAVGIQPSYCDLLTLVASNIIFEATQILKTEIFCLFVWQPCYSHPKFIKSASIYDKPFPQSYHIICT